MIHKSGAPPQAFVHCSGRDSLDYDRLNQEDSPCMRKQSKCRWRLAGLTALLLTLYSPQAKADSVLLTFEGIGDFQLVGNFL